MISQIVINVLISAAPLILIALGFELIYSTSRFFHFSHGIIISLGAYLTYFFLTYIKISLLFSIILAVVFTSMLGGCMDLIFFKPLKKRNGTTMTLLLTSLGLYYVIQNILSLIYGDDNKRLIPPDAVEGLNILGGKIMKMQIFIILSSLALIILIILLYNYTKLGKSIKAISCNNSLSEICGIRCDIIILLTFVIGSALAGYSGILMALDTDFSPNMGMTILLYSVVAVLIGRKWQITGIVIIAIMLSTLQSIIIWILNNQWADIPVFLCLILYLLFNNYSINTKKSTL